MDQHIKAKVNFSIHIKTQVLERWISGQEHYCSCRGLILVPSIHLDQLLQMSGTEFAAVRLNGESAFKCGKHCPGTDRLSRQNRNPARSPRWPTSWMAQATGQEPVYFLHPNGVAYNRLYGLGGGELGARQRRYGQLTPKGRNPRNPKPRSGLGCNCTGDKSDD